MKAQEVSDVAQAGGPAAEREAPLPDDYVKIFDTTLRDGEQAPGFSMTVDQKIEMARMLAELRVDIIEAGFAAASPGDFTAVERIAAEVEGPVICSLSRSSETDIRQAGRALRPAAKKRIHVFLATSPIHRQFKLNMSAGEVLEAAVRAIGHAREWTDDVEFSPEDAIRTEREFLAEICEAVIKAGATTVNIPDTVGYTTPEEIRDLFSYLRRTVPGMDGVTMSTHCHDDLGMAVANSLAAVSAGARQIEGAINGIGERAGNCSLEEAVMALQVRREHFDLDTGVRTQKFYAASRLLSALTGNPVSRNKAIVGANAFAHEAGIHQHGVLQNKETYEIMKPEDIGVPVNTLVLGKHSGKHALAARAEALGHSLSDNHLKSVFVAFKALADRKKEITDSDLEALILGRKPESTGPWRLEALHVSTGFGINSLPYAAVELTHEDGRRLREAATGDGPLDAVFNAIRRMTGTEMTLESLSIRNVTGGADAQGEADVHASCNDRQLHGRGVSTDVLAAGAEAIVDVVNRITWQSTPPQSAHGTGEDQGHDAALTV